MLFAYCLQQDPVPFHHTKSVFQLDSKKQSVPDTVTLAPVALDACIFRPLSCLIILLENSNEIVSIYPIRDTSKTCLYNSEKLGIVKHFFWSDYD